MDQAAAWTKMDAAFDFFTRLGAPFYCFHGTPGNADKMKRTSSV